MFESRGEFSVPIEFSFSANLHEVSSELQTRSHDENRSRSSKQHLSRVSLICPLSSAPPKAIAIYPDITYEKMDQEAARFAGSLAAIGLQKGDRISVTSRLDFQTICLLFGAWRLSLIVTLMPPMHRIDSIPCKLAIDDPRSILNENISEKRELDSSSLSLLLLTSGSSGQPKWAAFTIEQLFDSADTVVSALKAQPQDRWLASLPMHHVGGLGVILRSIRSFGTILFDDKKKSYPERILSAESTFASLVPTQFYRLLQHDFQAPSTHFLIGGAPMSQNLYEKAIHANLNLSLTYGLTEMSSTVLLSPHPIWQDQLPFLGRPLMGREAMLKNGELLVRGKSLFSGYGYPPQKVSDWFSTGDLAKWDESLGYAICGRKDSMFISGGENIHPEEIELAIMSCENVEMAIVVPLFDDEYGARPMAFVKTSKPFEKIRVSLSNMLPKHKIPIRFSAMPTNDHLKPKRWYLTKLANKNYQQSSFVNH